MKPLFSSVLALVLLIQGLFAQTGLSQPGIKKVWWKETVFYQVYMPSYADSNGDGYGDFKGMTAKLGYLQSLGIRGIWLTPFLRSPKVDNGYDVSSYYDVDPTYGTNEDFEIFLQEAHRRGIRVIMDMVVNHTSTDSKWFREARKGKDNPYRNYYIWRDKPNNWESFFGGTAWQKDSLTDQYYYHKFDPRMADLNWSDPAVAKEINNVFRYWLKLGVDGFRLDVINFLTTEKAMPDNPVKDGKQQHLYDIDQRGALAAIRAIRKTVDEFPDRFLVGEIGSDQVGILKKYQGADKLDVVFNFNFGSIAEFSAKRIFDEMQSMERKMPGYPTLFFGSHDMPRLIDRLAWDNPKRARTLAALLLTAKGVPFIYYGEEIGMRNIVAATPADIRDVQGRTFYQLAIAAGKPAADALREGNDHNRDKSRSPMQWDSSAFAGFSAKTAWINVNDNFKTINVAAATAQDSSLLKAYQTLIAQRNANPVLQYGAYAALKFDAGMISFTRVLNGERVFLVFNFGAPRTIITTTGRRPLFVGTDEFALYR